MASHDSFIHRAFHRKEFVQDLVRRVVPPEAKKYCDLPTVEQVPDDYINANPLRGERDAVWKMRLRGGAEMYILLFAEPKPDRLMALRITTNTILTWLELAKNGELSTGQTVPPVLPIVVYTGLEPWKVSLRLGDLLNPAAPRPDGFQPEQEYVLVDLLASTFRAGVHVPGSTSAEVHAVVLD